MPGQALNFGNAFPATLSSAALSTGTISITSKPGTWPAVPYRGIVDWGLSTQEVVIVTAQSGTGPFTLTCTRGADGTTAQAHSSGASFMAGYSAQDFGQPAALSTGVFNVCDPQFGAKGNGSTDDTAAIQAAANALSANGGGRLYFPCTGGDYITSAPVTISSYGDGVHIMGDGYGSRIRATGDYDTIVVNSGNGVAFSYLYFDSTVGRNSTDTGCTTTSGSNQVIDPQAASADLGSAISGAGIPGGTTITAVNTGTSTYTISANATATAAGTATLTVIGSTAGSAINLQTGGSVRINNVWCYNSFNALSCFNGGGRTEIVNSWFYGRNYGIYTQNPLHILSTGISGDSIGVVSDSCNGSLWMMGCDLNGISSLVTRNTLGLAQPNYGITLINVGANYNGGGITPPEGTIGFDMTQCYGELRMYACYASGSSLRMGGRADTVTITSGSPTFTDASAVSGDVGKNLYASGIPAGTTVSTVVGTTVTMSANATGNGSRTVGVGGPIIQDVELTGGDYGGDNSTPPHGIPQAILINSAQNVRISGIQVQGAANNTFPGILVNALTGPLTISGIQVTRPTLYAVDISTLGSTAGPVNISSSQFNGEYVTSPVNYNASFQSNYTFLGNDAGPNFVNGLPFGSGTSAPVVLASAFPTTATSAQPITGLGIAVSSGDTWVFEVKLYVVTSVATGTNFGVGMTGPSTSACIQDVEYWPNTSANSANNKWQVDASLTSHTATSASTTQVIPVRISATVTFSASGTASPTLSASTGGGTATAQVGCKITATKI